MLDNLTPLKEPAFARALNDLDDLLMQSGKAFLLGAGCSKCAGLPLTAELTAMTLASTRLDATTKTILTAIQGLFSGAIAGNIEDYLSELVDLVAIAERRGARGTTTTIKRYLQVRLAGSRQVVRGVSVERASPKP
jgi:hypothetical protein